MAKSSLDPEELLETLAQKSLPGERLDQMLDIDETLSEDAEQLEAEGDSP